MKSSALVLFAAIALPGLGLTKNVPAPRAISVAVPSEQDNAIASRILDSLVEIFAYPDDQPGMESIGTGFFINRHQVITNAHVVANCSQIYLRFAHQDVISQVSILNTNLDVAVLEVANSPAHQYLKIRDSSTLRQGEACIAIGFPYGQFNSTYGTIITAFGRADVGFNPILLQMTAPIDLGNSGGPVVDAAGQVIGMATMFNPNAYYAISSNAFSEAANINHYHSGITEGLSVHALEKN